MYTIVLLVQLLLNILHYKSMGVLLKDMANLIKTFRPDQINVLVVGFPDPNYPESEF